MKVPRPTNEQARLLELSQYKILDTNSEKEFDEIAFLASKISGVPFALINFVDESRHWIKSALGLQLRQIDRDSFFCARTILSGEPLLVEDASQDKRFANDPFVAETIKLKFYLGVPLIAPSGQVMGTLCVLDVNPRKATADQVSSLQILARQIVNLLELRRTNIQLKARLSDTLLAKEKMKEQQEFHMEILNHLPVALFCKDALGDFRITTWNKKAQEMWEISDREALGKTDYDLFGKETADLMRAKDLETMSQREVLEIQEEQVFSKNERAMLLHTLRVPVYDKNGRPRYLLGISEDITARKEAEEMITRTSEMAALGEVTSGLAQELVNPLAIIRECVRMIESTVERGDIDHAQLTKTLKKIDVTTLRMGKAVNGLRTFSRQGVSVESTKVTSIQNVIQDTVELCSNRTQRENISLKCFYPPQHIFLDCHVRQISQVLLHLLDNAFDAVEGSEDKWVEIMVRDQNDLLSVSVTDSGPGIPDDVQEKIMSAFFTTKNLGKGNGLGLSISKGIVEKHGGTLEFDMSHAHTRFIFTLPKSKGPGLKLVA